MAVLFHLLGTTNCKGPHAINARGRTSLYGLRRCGSKGYGFSAVLVINRVSIFAALAISVINRVWLSMHKTPLFHHYQKELNKETNYNTGLKQEFGVTRDLIFKDKRYTSRLKDVSRHQTRTDKAGLQQCLWTAVSSLLRLISTV